MSLTLKAVKSQDISTSVNREQMLDKKQDLLEDIKNKVTSDLIHCVRKKGIPYNNMKITSKYSSIFKIPKPF